MSAALLVAAVTAAYGRTFSVPFLFDDNTSIALNPSIRRWSTALWPPLASTSSGRPVLNLSLAINYALGGMAVGGYHAVNLLIHELAGLALFGIVRRTIAPWTGPATTAVALSIALLWALHPLQTESVTYLIQRAESLMGLFYLLTLYGFIRGAGSGGRQRLLWFALSFAACLLGMGTKEVMASAPLIVLLYDRTFLAGSFAEAWRRRWRIHAGLAATWLLLFLLVLSTHGRNQTAGFGGVVSWSSYALTQFPAIAHYLRLCFWPAPLVFDYGSALALPSPQVLASVLVVTGLVAASVWALVCHPELGFLGACFFAILAPSSSIVPVATQTMAEHRMYLPLIPVVALAALGLCRWLGRAGLPLCLVLAASFLIVTWRRNGDYQSALALWSDTVVKHPEASRAQNNLGVELAKIPGREPEAIAHFEEALRLKPDFAEAHNNLGDAWSKVPGRLDEAVAEYEEALRLNPDYAKAHNNLGNAWLSVPGRLNDAIVEFKEAVRLRPDYAEAHNDLAMAWSLAPDRLGDAIAEFQEALRLWPDFAEAHQNLGNAYVQMPGRLNDAIAQYEEALRLKPDSAVVHHNLAIAYAGIGRTAEAIEHLRIALRLNPGYEAARRNLQVLEDTQGR